MNDNAEYWEQTLQRWVRPAVRDMDAYHVHDPEGLIKLDAMENPYTFPQWMVEKWLGVLRQIDLNRYPDPSGRALKARLRELYQVADDFDIVLGNGSDELIQMLALTVGAPGRVMLAPAPTFVMYRSIAAALGMDYVGVPLSTDFSLDLDRMLAAIQAHEPALVFLAYPNNPTGNLFARDGVEQILRVAPGLVVVDEAYFSFAGETFMTELGRWPNLVVMRTLSKMGLAGLRLGWMAGRRQWLGEVEKTRLPYNIGSLTQASTVFALEHAEVFERQTRDIVAERARLAAELAGHAGIEVYPSDANFVLFRAPAGKADAIFNGLKEQGVLIKNMNGAGGVLSGFLRVTAGTVEENDAFIDALRKCLQGA